MRQCSKKQRDNIQFSNFESFHLTLVRMGRVG